MGLKVGVALLMVLLISNSGITDAVRQRTEDVPRVSNAPELSTHHVEKHLLREDSSLKLSPSSSSSSPGDVVVGVILIGSSAPDCAHTCGACSPCTVQVVSFECSSQTSSSAASSSSSSSSSSDLHAEACPLGYLCVCHGRAFPIP